MKKLMIVAAAAALAGVASASNVFDYKASVKYVDFKLAFKAAGGAEKGYVKVVKSTSIKGYLVTPQDCPCDVACAARQPGFLVVTSSLAKKYDKERQVKLLPANLLADIWAQKNFKEGTTSATLQAQGYLFAGYGKSAFPLESGSPVYGFGDIATEATKYLFGQANIEDKEGQFIEPFLDAAGFGKAGFSATEAPICGKGTTGLCLKSLKGSVIGGSWSCLANCYIEDFRCQGWDDEAIETGTSIDYTGFGFKYNVISGTWQIKENTKIEAVNIGEAAAAALAEATGIASLETAELVTACGQKLQKTFNLATFDMDAAKSLRGEFVKKWFAPTAE